MQEFSSISVSSYEAGALADQLTERSRAGWSVVAIVPTGSSVIAYLSRDTDGHGTDETDAPVVAATPTAEPSVDAAPADEPAEPAAETPGWAAGAAATPDATASTPTADAGDHFTPDEPVAEPAPEPVVEAAPGDMTAATAGAGAAPAGWYADPSSRFELRYWDGSQWTEHVSRAGQQYTDPPVA